MAWTDSVGIDVTSAFQGITTPPRELYDEIHGRGWEVQKVDVNGDGLYEATVKNPYGETLAKTGPDPQTALGHCLVGIMRQETMRYPRVAAWTDTWEQERPEIAEAYADAPTYDPKAAGAWKELGEDSMKRAEAIANQIKVDFTHDPYPYKNVNEMQDDIRNKQHVTVSKANLAHPLWSSDQALAYRLVHDVLGHAAVGGDWGWHGENGATSAHMPLLTPNAQKALFTEAIGQAAHNGYYQTIAPQKIVFLDDYLTKVQERENAAGHPGVHPSQSLVPAGIPSIEDKTSAVTERIDPNYGWQSGVEPLPDNAYLWQKEDTGRDPLDHEGLRDQQFGLHSGWFNVADHDGMPDLESQRQAVANAFRGVLLEPRQTPRWAATHYQHIMNVPPGVSDPIRFSDTLEAQREAHNKARGLPEGIARGEMAEGATLLRNWIKGLNPKLDDTEVESVAKRELFHMIAEEEAQVTADDPTGKLLPMQITDAVNKGLKRRLAVLTKPNIDQKFDFGKERLFHKGFNAPDPGVYGDFLNSHIRPIAGVGLHIDDLTRAAREDVANHGGKGHHFRSKAVDLVPGVGPRQVSHAWYRLQPHTSELGVIGPSVSEQLGYDPEKEIPNRDYFKLERQLAAGRDAAGYGHIPLGSFSQGMHDNINYGHGVHRDLSPFKVINPTPYDQVDWTQYPNLSTSNFGKPYWWDSTKPNREQVGKDWDQIVATQHPADSIPFRTSKVADYIPPQPTSQWQLPDTQNAKGVVIPVVAHPQTGEEIEGEPGLSLMQHIKHTLGLGSAEEVWAQDPHAYKR